MRLFTGIALPPNVVDRLSEILDELRPMARINWSPAENLHITLKFIGEWPDDRLSTLTAELGTVAFLGPLSVTISGFGFFPNSHHPHSLFADVRSNPELAELASLVDRAVVPLGCVREKRPYRPHVTLARIKPASDIRALSERIATTTRFDLGAFEARDFHLYQSKSSERGSIYTKLATYDLMRENNANS